MYYLNDKHPEFEYAVYCRVGGACPYLVPRTFDSINSVYNFIKDVEKRHNRYHQIFYIDNDFYENQYDRVNENGTYYKVLRRQVFDWEEFSTKLNCTNKNNVVNMFDYTMRR